MPKYRKLPVIIEAEQFINQETPTESIINFLGNANYDFDEDGTLFINTLEGQMKASPGDYIIKGIQGEFYPCKPDIFEKTYEPWDYKEDPV